MGIGKVGATLVAALWMLLACTTTAQAAGDATTSELCINPGDISIGTTTAGTESSDVEICDPCRQNDYDPYYCEQAWKLISDPIKFIEYYCC